VIEYFALSSGKKGVELTNANSVSFHLHAGLTHILISLGPSKTIPALGPYAIHLHMCIDTSAEMVIGPPQREKKAVAHWKWGVSSW
jgi:hypothetical protein